MTNVQTFALRAIALSTVLAACGDDTTAADTGGGSTSNASTSTSASTSASTSDGSSTAVASTAASSSGGDGGAGGAGTGTGGEGTGTGGEGGAPAVIDLDALVINEVSLDGLDWIELYNGGDQPVDLEGVRIADQDKDNPGTPKLAGAVTFTGDAAIVPQGGYLFVLADQDPAGEGPQDVCDPGPAPCFHTGWGLSTGDGDIVFLLAPDDTVLLQVAIGPNAAIVPTTWSRLPNGTGEFGVGTATPGAANEPAAPK